MFVACHFDAGHVYLSPSGTEIAACGEVKTVVCFADKTNHVTVSASNPTFLLGNHTYQRNSARRAKAGPVELNLINVTVSSFDTLLSEFNLTASERHNETVTIQCTDVHSTDKVEFKTDSEFLRFFLWLYFMTLYIHRWSKQL